MKYYLENMKRYLIYMYFLIINREIPKLRLIKQYDKLNIEQKQMFNEKFINPIDLGVFKTINNKWGEYKLKKDEEYIQSIFKSDNKVGWRYSTPNKNRGVIGFPEMFIGKSPFGGESTSIQFPKKIKDIIKIIANYDVSMYIEPKKYNLVFDLWITRNNKPEVKDISHEIMIWEDRNVASPAGKFIMKVNTSFGIYKVYHTWMDRSSENLGIDGWYFTAFVRQDRRRNGVVDVKEIIDIMISEGILNENHFLSTVEFGNEIYNSCGYTIINEYRLDIK